MSLNAQQLCAECLGLLGALDPARLSLKMLLPEALSTTEQKLIMTLVSRHLVRILRTASNLQALDSVTFAIQVITLP